MIDLATLGLSPKQIVSVARADARINVWHGAIRSGKTIASLLAFLGAVRNAPSRGLVIVVGRTLDTIGRNVMEPLVDGGLFGDLSDHVHWVPGAKTAVVFGRVVHLVGASDVKAEPRIRGATVCLAYVDEASLVPQAFFKQLLGRMSVKGAKMLATTNPDNPGHWLKKEYLDRAGELNLKQWQFKLDDNPGLDDDYLRAIKSEYVGLWYRRFILGQWVQSEGAVFESWDDTRHVVDVLPPITRWVSISMDYGTTNPFSAMSLGVGADQKLYLASEWRWDSKKQQKQLTDVEYSKRVRAWAADQPTPGSPGQVGVRPEWWVVDPSATSFRTQLHQDGITAKKARNDVKDGIRVMASLIAADKLFVHRSCQGFVDEMPGYSWDSKSSEKGQDAPIKLDDHSIDAARYGLFTTRAVWSNQIQLAA